MVLKFGAINGFSTGKDGGSVHVTVPGSDVSDTAVTFCHVAVELFLVLAGVGTMIEWVPLWGCITAVSF